MDYKKYWIKCISKKLKLLMHDILLMFLAYIVVVIKMKVV